MSIVIAEDLWWPIPDYISTKHQVVYDPSLYQDPERLISVAKAAKALVVRNRTQVDRQLLACLPKLRVVGRLGVGLDNINLDTCRERGIVVTAARGGNANSVAEYVIASIFQHARFLSKCDAQTRKGVWDRQICMGREIYGKTLGLIGVGDIGHRVAIRARAMGMKVIAYDPFLLSTNMLVQDFGVKLTTIEEVCRESDYLSLHVPLIPATFNLIGTSELNMMKENVVLINTARGGIVDEEALLSHLTEFTESFAILDVRETEPPSSNDPFVRLPNVLLTPHISGITYESSQRVAEMVLADIDRVITGQQAHAYVE